jgi:hypothetical protein
VVALDELHQGSHGEGAYFTSAELRARSKVVGRSTCGIAEEVKGGLAVCIGGALLGCAGQATSSPRDGGGAEASPIDEAGTGPLDATTDRVDGGGDAQDATAAEAATTDTGPDAPEVQLGVPTFVPPSGVVDDEEGVMIQAPAGFPANGQILFTMNGESPVTAGDLYTGVVGQVDEPGYSTATVMAIARAAGPGAATGAGSRR